VSEHQYYYLDKFNHDDFEFEDIEEDLKEEYEAEGGDKKKVREKWIINKAKNHKGFWLIDETKAWEYYRKAEKLRRDIDALTVGLKNTYELTDLEAINIINGRYIMEYVVKYRKMKAIADEEKKKDKENGKDLSC